MERRERTVCKLELEEKTTVAYYKKRMEHIAIDCEDRIKQIMTNCNDRIESMESELTYYKSRLQDLVEKTSVVEDSEKFSKYDTRIRESVYYCQSVGVASRNTGEIIRKVMETMCGKQLIHIPSKSTVENMTRELNIISDLQVSMAILSDIFRLS